ncbi:hypothetical protein BVC93_30050 [Mycobacterium sp. MS1601]|uniref:hypothetical protein n=1 Tax=Mycobacterium sp. MS1601 TaxID=1936029 RepID=UPI00097972C1|nr:hypothetical protein [Mycobacterium sp. MS1601]AQA06857.1 hypothetical protein BVC93_30050 [Mycobacterium sp. MS1601]
MPVVPPRVTGPLRRREVLVGALGLTALTLTSCSAPPPPDVDELRAQLALATSDSELARAAAVAAPRAAQPALVQIAGERARHAQALADEISRTLGTVVPPTLTSTSTSTTTTSGTPQPPSPAPGVDDVAAALRSSAGSAADYAARESGYRAGLLGSIAAACTAAYTVALPRTST